MIQRNTDSKQRNNLILEVHEEINSQSFQDSESNRLKVFRQKLHYHSHEALTMASASQDCACYFRIPADRTKEEGDTTTLERQAEDQSPEEEEYILCRQCHQAITKPAERIAMQGLHRHTFANPHGVVFEIGCFRSVKGCGYAGAASDDFSWFAGYSWRVCFCTLCLTHLGWMFSLGGDNIFYGLILDRLIEPG